MTEPWWPIYRITFSKPQMRWLIDNLGGLRNGIYPPRPLTYIEPPRMACSRARERGYTGYCLRCPIKPCLSPGEKTPGRVRKEPPENRVREIAAEVDCRLDLVLDYISGWPRPTKAIKRRRKNFEAKRQNSLDFQE